MKKSFLIILALVCVAITVFFAPVSAKDGTTNPDPVCDICTKLNQLVAANPTTGISNILTALGVLQTDVTNLKTDVSGLESDIADLQDSVDAIDCGSGNAYNSVMYTSPAYTNMVVVDVYAPGATDTYTVTVKDWHKGGSTGSWSYTNENSCEGGAVTLSPFNHEITCGFGGDEMKIIQIIIPKAIQDKVTFNLVNDNIIHGPGEWKIDYI